MACECNKEKLNAAKELFKNKQVKSARASGSGPCHSTVDGSFICTFDSFGFRSELPGECSACYAEYQKQYAEDMCYDDN